MLTLDIPYTATERFYNLNGNRTGATAGGGESLAQTLIIGNDVGALPITATGLNPFQVNAGVGGVYLNSPTGNLFGIFSGVTVNASVGFAFNDGGGSPQLNIDCVGGNHYFLGVGGANCKLGINRTSPNYALDVLGSANIDTIYCSDIQNTGGAMTIMSDGGQDLNVRAGNGTGELKLAATALTMNGNSGLTLNSTIGGINFVIENGIVIGIS